MLVRVQEKEPEELQGRAPDGWFSTSAFQIYSPKSLVPKSFRISYLEICLLISELAVSQDKRVRDLTAYLPAFVLKAWDGNLR